MRAPQHLQGYPWESLELTTNAEVQAQRSVMRWVDAFLRTDRVTAALSDLLHVSVEVLLGRVRALNRTSEPENAIGVAFSPAGASDKQRVLVEVERALGVVLVARAVGRRPPAVVDRGPHASPNLAGAVAAVLAAAARRAHADTALSVLGAGDASALETDLARGDPDLVAVTATILVDNEAFAARIVAPRGAVASAPTKPWSFAALTTALGGVVLSLPIVACASRATAAEVGSLGIGDVWFPGNWPLNVGDKGALGAVVLAPPSSEVGIRAQFAEDGILVLRGDVDALCVSEAPMGEPADKGGLLEAIGEVPVVVRVEIGEASMLAREWATLRPGDVVTLGRRVGEPVVLRVGGIVVARGDLVSVDGEVGVRIAERVMAEKRVG